MKNIKILKSQSLLHEVLQEAFCVLDDVRINSLSITEVDCSKGKESAKVFLDPLDFSREDKIEILRALKKASSAIRVHLQSALGWYKIPALHYEFDERLENMNKLNAIFKEIEKKNAR